MTKEQHFDGLGVAAGIAIGTAYVRESGAVDVPERRIPKKEIEKEQKRLKVAVRLARRQIRLVQSRAAAKSGAAVDELTSLLDAYLPMPQDSRLGRGAAPPLAHPPTNADAAATPRRPARQTNARGWWGWRGGGAGRCRNGK